MITKVLRNFFLGILATVLIGSLSYYIRLKMIEKSAEHFITKSQEYSKQVLEQQRSNLQAKQRQAEHDYKKAQEEHAFNEAFYAWYTEPDGCDNWKSDSHMVECVNHKINAKNTFKSIYQNN
ncbi:hypothetical protein H0A36_24965 [Endozoicomonas sp. SM1973]|uniref:Uncharacterized protein n=2 Tax=Spartinivicinus TaxID=2768738 RepID=A0A853IJM1_9GAMM|nr:MULTISPECIES: hypothetical protein [Spartinivicinus]MCX4030322.1 hypothetical protein [Spartinivicinus marinus]MDE1465502.1 hypothetical protein [Spartinivicinus sp. A2-2]NYZ69275.1 hypothetical protein [Spartinivicinus marinus]